MPFVKRERSIEDLVCRFPGLLEIADGYTLLRQYQYLDGSRVDVLFRWPTNSLVVEVKKEPLCPGHVRQIKRYLRFEVKERGIQHVAGLLLCRISPRANFIEQEIKDQHIPLQVKYLERDFSLAVNYCRNCAKPFWSDYEKCPACSSRDFILIDFHED
jgi:hypothetical protein